MSKIDEETLRFLFEKEKSNRDKVIELRRSLAKDLEDECLNLTGHDWWPWKDELCESICVEWRRYRSARECSICKKRESKEIPEEIKRLKEDYGTDI